jgi:hypothetical protein
VVKLANILAFQIGWFSCILGAAWGWPMAGPLVVVALVALHLYLSAAPVGEAPLLFVVAFVGTVIDSLHAAWGVVSFHGNQPFPWVCPLWMSALWMIFATTLRGALGWMEGRYRLAFVLGALAGPGSYYAGARLGAIALNENLAFSLTVLAAVWAVTLPGLFWLSRHLSPSRSP